MDTPSTFAHFMVAHALVVLRRLGNLMDSDAELVFEIPEEDTIDRQKGLPPALFSLGVIWQARRASQGNHLEVEPGRFAILSDPITRRCLGLAWERAGDQGAIRFRWLLESHPAVIAFRDEEKVRFELASSTPIYGGPTS